MKRFYRFAVQIACAIKKIYQFAEVVIVDAGEGYIVTPEIIVDDAVIFEFTDNEVDYNVNSIQLSTVDVETGDLLKLTNYGNNILTKNGFCNNS